MATPPGNRDTVHAPTCPVSLQVNIPLQVIWASFRLQPKSNSTSHTLTHLSVFTSPVQDCAQEVKC